ncbi:MAG: DUF1566 domain-containing protein [Pseudomonadota bacterium]
MHRKIKLISVLLCSICFLFEAAHAAAPTPRQFIEGIYVAYWGRAADPEGLNYWEGSYNAGTLDYAGIAENFASSPEGTGAYEYFDTVFNHPENPLTDEMRQAFVVAIYQNLFNRAPDAAGLAYWVDILQSGASSPGVFIANIINSAYEGREGESADDWKNIEAKILVAEYYTNKVIAAGITWTVENNHQQAVDVLNGINKDSDIDAAKRAIDALFPSVTGNLPDTGQTTSYTDTFGEDSDYSIRPPSYTKLDETGTPLAEDAPGWAMVRDNVTGLIWESKTEDGSIHDKDNRYIWYDPNPETNGGDAGEDGDGTDTQDFIDALNSAAFGGFSDWRLPSLHEMRTIFDYGVHNPALDTQYFPNKPSTTEYENFYWSTATHANGSAVAWFSVFYNGHCYYGAKSWTSLFARAVRGGQAGLLADSATPGRMIDNGDETITDSTTGLMWQKQVDETPLPWEEAIANCESMTLATHNDWRMPNIKELYSIVDFGKYDLAIDTELFPNTGATVFWSSTTINEFIDNAWCVDFYEGYHLEGTKSDSFYVRAVRNVQ